jgi:AcrR family transcriptional regulator
LNKSRYPLRNRRRKATREQLLHAASQILAKQSYRDATLEQIAEHAGLHVQTLYNHFPTKQALAAALEREKFANALKITDRDTLSFWRQWVEDAAASQIALDSGASFMRYVHDRESDPKLAAAVLEIGREYTEVLTEALARDFGVDSQQDSFPTLVASMLWGGNSYAVRQWYEAGGEQDLVALTVAVVDDVIAIVDSVRGGNKRKRRRSVNTPAEQHGK